MVCYGSTGWNKALTEVREVANLYRRVYSVDQARQVYRDDNDQRRGGSPVDTGLVAIDALILVQHRNVEMGFAQQPKVGDLVVSVNTLTRSRRRIYSP